MPVLRRPMPVFIQVSDHEVPAAASDGVGAGTSDMASGLLHPSGSDMASGLLQQTMQCTGCHSERFPALMVNGQPYCSACLTTCHGCATVQPHHNFGIDDEVCPSCRTQSNSEGN